MTKAFANALPVGTNARQSSASIELVCPADTLVQLRAAVDNGADWIQLRLSSRSRHAGDDSNINVNAMVSGIRYAHDRRCKVAIRLDACTQASSWTYQCQMIDRAAAHGVDAIELSNHALMLYAAAHYPHLQLHYSSETVVDAASIGLLKRQLNVSLVALPRLLSMADLIRVSRDTTVDLQLHGYCRFSSVIDHDRLQRAATEKSLGKEDLATRTTDSGSGQCATAESAANDGCFNDKMGTDVKVLRLLPQLSALGVRAICIEAPGTRLAHLAHITRIWREAIDEYMENADRYVVRPSWITELNNAARQLQSH